MGPRLAHSIASAPGWSHFREASFRGDLCDGQAPPEPSLRAHVSAGSQGLAVFVVCTVKGAVFPRRKQTDVADGEKGRWQGV